jgi:hypothetical protein
MFQLIYLTFTQPRADPEAFRAATAQLTAALANRQALPEAAFEDALTAAVSQNHLRARPLTADSVPQMNLEKSMAFYRDRFADASDFTFVFVGSFDLPTPGRSSSATSLPVLNRRRVGETSVSGRLSPSSDAGHQRQRRRARSASCSGPFQNNRGTGSSSGRWWKRSPGICSGCCARISAARMA